MIKKIKKNWLVICILLGSLMISIGYSIRSIKLYFDGVDIKVRVKEDIRVTGMGVNSSNEEGLSNWEEHNVKKILTSVNLPNENSTVTYRFDVTNIGNTEMGILKLDGLPDNLDYSFENYNLKDKICDSEKCNLGVEKEILLTIKYKENGFNPDKVTYNLDLDVDFRRFHKIVYENIDNIGYPVEKIDGDDLNINLTPKIYKLDVKVDGNLYEQNNGYTFNNHNLVITNINGEVSLFAYYEKQKIHYHNNGGEGCDVQDVEYGTNIGNMCEPTREGYTFLGWFTSEDSDEQVTVDKVLKDNIDVYAHWKGNTYGVTLDLQGGSDGTVDISPVYGDDMPEIVLPTRTGYTFDGYFTKKNGEGEKYYNADGSSAKKWDKANKGIILYASWIANEYGVTLDLQGGTSGTTNINPTFDAEMPEIEVPKRKGYTFKGFFDKKEAGEKYYNEDGSSAKKWDKAEDSVTLFARWSANKYDITFDKQEGSGGSDSIEATFDQALPKIEPPKRTGYIFQGYFDSASGGVKYYNADGSSAKNWDKDADTKLFAQWEIIKYTLTYDPNSGYGTMDKTICEYGRYCTISNNLYDKDGYAFVGWNTKAAGDGDDYEEGKQVILTQDLTLYAQWKKAVTIKFHKNGSSKIGSGNEEIVTLKCVISNDGTSCNIKSPNITPATGFSSLGYATSANAIEGSWTDGEEKKVSEDADYYAITRSNEKIVITFNKNGAQTISKESDSCYRYNGSATCNITSPSITPSGGFEALGWNKNKAALSSEWSQNESRAFSASDEYFAITKSTQQLTATFNKNGVTEIGKENEQCTRYNGSDSCKVTLPSIKRDTFTILGWSTDPGSSTGTAVNTQVSISKDTTFYAITSKEITITFYKNGAQSLTPSGKEESTANSISEKCTIKNSAVNCGIMSPTIKGTTNTPTVIGFSKSTGDHNSSWAHNSLKNVDNNDSYYAQTRNDDIPRYITFNKNGSTSFTYSGNKYTDNSKQFTLCTIGKTYNGVAIPNSCSATITFPVIEVSSNTPVIIGWSNSATNHTKEYDSGQKDVTLTASSNLTYYAQTKKNSINKTITFNKNGNTSFTYKSNKYTDTSKTFDLCTIPEVWDGTAQATSCKATITFPTIEASGNTPTVVGWSDGAANHTKAYDSGQASVELSTSNDLTYYAQTKKAQGSLKLNFNANGNSINATEKSCTLAEVWNGTAQATTCGITTPTITAPANTPTIVGFSASATDRTSIVGSNAAYTLNSTNNGKTYYAQTKKAQGSFKLNFNANGNSINATEKSCTLAEVWNGVAQATTCGITTPTITAPTNTPTIIGFSAGATDRTSIVGSNASYTLNSSNNGKTYYAQTRNDDIPRYITFNKNNNTSFTYGGNRYTDNSKQFTLCTIGKTYNGVAIPNSCSATITFPSIEASGNTPTVVGWSDGAANHTKAYNSGQSGVALTANNNLTYYAQTKKDAVPKTITFDKNGSTSFTYSGNRYTDNSKQFTICTIPEVWNGTSQATSCKATITFPTIEASGNTPTIIGWSNGAANHTKAYDSGQKDVALTMSSNLTYYAQTKKAQGSLKLNFNANGNSINATEKSCTLAEVWNGTAQATTCGITTPTITAPGNTPTIVGFSASATDRTSIVGSNAAYTLNSSNNGKTYYAQTKKAQGSLSLNFNANGNSINATNKSCTLAEVWNGVAQATTCGITTPTITAPSNTPTIVGFSASATDRASIVGSNASYTLNSSNNGKTYYAQTKKAQGSLSLNFNANGNTINATSKSCTLAEVWNGVAQATTCGITTPTITAPSNTPTIIGYSSSSTDRTKIVGSNTSYTLNSSNTGKTYYAQTSGSLSKTITFYKNGAYSLDGSTASSVTRSCSSGTVYNNTKPTCSITSPKIVGTGMTTSVEGFATTSGGSSSWSHNTSKTVDSSTATSYYAQTYGYSYGSTRTVYFSYNSSFVSSIGATSRSCSPSCTAYNGSTCSPSGTCYVSSVSITPKANFTALGWNTSSTATSAQYSQSSSIGVSSSGTTYYAVVRPYLTSCPSTGSTLTLGNTSWRVVTSGSSYCDLALNGVSSTSGAYSSASTNVQNEYLSSGPLGAGKASGKISSLGTYTSTTGLPSGIIWTGSSSASYVNTSFTKYSVSNSYITKDGKYGTALTYSNVGVSTSTDTSSKTGSCTSVSGTSCMVSGASRSSSSWGYGSLYHSKHDLSTSGATSSSFNMARKVYQHNSATGTSTNPSQKVLNLAPCGGSDFHAKTLFIIKAVSSKNIHYQNKRTGTNSDYSISGRSSWYLAGSQASTTSGTTRTYNYGSGSNCVNYSSYTVSSGSIGSIKYRPYIRINFY